MADFSLESMAAHLLHVASAMPMAKHSALAEAAKIVETEAKAEIGVYQDGIGPFGDWVTLAESTREDRVQQGYSEDEPLLRSGEMRESIGSIVGEDEAHVGSNDDRAVWQELGTVNIPPRSFLGGSAARKSEEVKNIIGHTMVASLIKPGTAFANGKEVVVPIP